MKLSSRQPRIRSRNLGLPSSRPSVPRDEERGPKLVKLRSLTPPPAERAIPDLLHSRPSISCDERALQHALSFGFVAGSAGGALRGALTHTAFAASSFMPEALQDGLFLEELISIAFAFSVHGRVAPLDRTQLRALLTRPSLELADIEQRQAILAELSEKPQLVAALERAYSHIGALPELLDDEGSDGRLDITHWRLDVLRAIRDSIAALDQTFAGAESNLKRLFEFGERVRRTEGYARLTELLDFEGDAARAQLQIRLAADGRIRSLEIVALRARSESPFHIGPLRRLWRQFSAWLKGYRIGSGEVVERWLESIFEGVREHVPTLLQLKGDLEFYLGSLHFRAVARAKNLPVCLPELVPTPAPGQKKLLDELWNPLLLGEARAPVTTRLELPNFACTCITTGPNSGGKTRFLQALAFSQLMGQAGSFVAARRALLKPVSGLFVSLGEAPHADQKEGRLGMELVRIRSLFEQARAGSLVVLDELCSGTNPSEGEEIIRMLLELLHELEHEVHVTTHFLSFAQALEREADALGLYFLQVELDGTQHPTYRFVPGVATTSLALQTAERLGVTRDQLRRMIRRDDGPR
jgi:DNA mismatch repair protein MutS2